MRNVLLEGVEPSSGGRDLWRSIPYAFNKGVGTIIVTG